MHAYDLVVIGAGTAGLVSAAAAAELGARVALIERERMGGDCLNTGCVPSKALLASARAAADARRAGRFGVRTGPVTVDFGVARFRRLGVDVHLGAARFVARDALTVGAARLPFLRAIIATGSRPAVPAVPGIDDVDYYTTDTIFELDHLPARLAVIGGGGVGCELGLAFARFGSRVTILESASRIMSNDDMDAAKLVGDSLEREGVRVLAGCKIRSASRAGEALSLEAVTSGVHERIVVDAILVGAGRTPNVEALGLDVAGVRHDAKAGIEVDDLLRTSNSRIFAAGDVCTPHRFTHVADQHARIAVQNALFYPWARVSSRVSTWCTYTDPEVAQVGLTPPEIERQGIDYETFSRELATVDRAVLEGRPEGFLKVHVRRGTDRILGATLVARHAGDTLAEVALAMEAGAGLDTIARTVHPYPTQVAVLRQVADDARRRRLTPFVRRVLAWWFGHPSLETYNPELIESGAKS